MIKLQHNPYIALYALANKMQEEITNMKQYYAIDELAKDIKVQVVKNSLKENLERLLTSNKHGLPTILIARGTNIATDVMRPIGGKNAITLISEDNQDTLYLEGDFYNYESDLQVIIITRTQTASMELQLELKRILNTVLRKVYYKLQIIRENEQDLWYCEDCAFIALDGFGEQFDTQSESDVYVTYITGKAREQYFKYSEANTANRYIIRPIVK